MHILICESGHFVRRALAEHLGSFGHQVSEVESGPECSDFISHTLPDLILIDGHEEAVILRQRNAQTPIIVLSGFMEREDLLSKVEYIQKPYQLSQVSRLIQSKFAQPSKK